MLIKDLLFIRKINLACQRDLYFIDVHIAAILRCVVIQGFLKFLLLFYCYSFVVNLRFDAERLGHYLP